MDKFSELGSIAWLWTNSELHQNWPLSLFSTNVIPAIETQQYVLLVRDGMPIAYCSWARLNLETEVKYINDVTSLKLEDWQSGDRYWFIDWIAPFGDSYLLTKHMRKLFSDGLFRAIRVDAGSPNGKISEFYGRNVDAKLAMQSFEQYQKELMNALSQQDNFIISTSK
ncbi:MULTISPECIES: toxin-activating lysine-acyltransferase [Kingella]|uniref:Protein-lysine myristoyltransferase RtxC n=12 Tax=Kingella TaxID=32257 RepID=RTXC_KINKI|nr:MULTISPECIES: toxin-activating lysine-acyltransferase [Kingella]A1YKW8.1 RecName: Full=Protein-lysine myristoyltransferase RtxC [Kingella kingae]ABK58602.1 RtxC [Kingella kingae]MDK4535812.1 toxin-activating lysine-acyltransferase [Kingella kingae]MDK4538338.1 toxin-activating lysine-acyltransferase [Kingella kingae]MDK4556041.1 toxin-activating lysine-acyltransferase [Kingella kingae]MDK4583498.1 toxin-activating lysine-acyltransferase [Kingella kingae]